MRVRSRSKKDANHTELVKYIRKQGATWQHTHSIPGALDGILGYRGIDQRVEIKNPKANNIRITDAEQKTFNEWKGRKPVVIVSELSVDNLLQNMRGGHD